VAASGQSAGRLLPHHRASDRRCGAVRRSPTGRRMVGAASSSKVSLPADPWQPRPVL